ncbi:MAG: hypothetical protein ACT4QC_17060 [Planctomycetaceae bacterium]
MHVALDAAAMNYFAHGLRFVDRPYFLAGTALPDWLSVVDRRTRLRFRRVAPFAAATGAPEAELAQGVLQHLEDDAWFHATPAFYAVSGALTREFRQLLPADDGHRPSLLGHVVTELLLDAVLIDRDPERLDAYYEALSRVDPQAVQQIVNRMARFPTERLAAFIPLFQQVRFLADYRNPHGLLFRLNQVLRRVKLSPLPEDSIWLLKDARSLVEAHAAALLVGFDATTQPSHNVQRNSA